MSDTTFEVQPRKDKKPEPKEKTKAEEEIDELIAQSEISDAKRKKQKQYIKKGVLAAVGVLFIWFVNYLFTPYKAGMDYGICKVFLERTVQYPQHMRVSTIEQFASSIRIWYTQLDSYGEYRLEPIQCFYRADENYGAALEKVTIRRREVDQEVVEAFNKTLPAIFAYPPDLTYPAPLPDSLADLQINTELYRKFRLPEYGR